MAEAAPTSPAVTALPSWVGADDDAREPRLEILVVAGEREDGHDLARGRDVEARLARHAVRLAAEADDAWRRKRSFMSIARPQVTWRGSSSPDAGVVVAEVDALSTSADRRLCAVVMAWMSPVKCRLMSSAGTSEALPPPVPPPFTPKTGPSDGSRSASTAFLPSRRMPIARPIDVVVLPSPAGVGLIAVTRMRRPLPPFARFCCRTSRPIFALPRPKISMSSSARPSSRATC